MLIDIHTHIFPDKIAPKTVEVLKAGIRKVQGEDYPVVNHTDATVSGLKKSMEENGVSVSFVMPIATKPTQFETINKYALEITDENIISFGSLHPMQDEPVKALEALCEMGIKGIKLHPEFQSFYIDGKESVEIIKRAHELDMWVMLHTGSDIGLPPPVHCTPDMLRNLLNYVPGNRIIAAHMGGWRMWEEAYDKLCGTPVYMDTAFVADFLEPELFLKMVRKHGADKIFFGSDSPWENPAHTLEYINSVELSDEELEKIKYKNAEIITGKRVK